MTKIDRRDFFISFNKADLDYANAIDAALKAEGFTTYYYPCDLGEGGSIPIWMDNALMNSAQTLALYSPDYTDDKAIYSKAEVYATLWQDPGGDERKLIPVVLSETKFTPLVAPSRRIEVMGLTPTEAGRRVVECLKMPEETEPRHRWQRLQALPKIFEAPYLPNPNFTGRFEALETLHRSLGGNRRVAITTIAGTGGVGKTTLAAEYCHRFGGQYEGVWTVRAEEAAVMLADLQELAKKLEVGTGQNAEADAKAALDELHARSRPWLLVYDNAPYPDAIRKWLPVGAVRCIITSRFAEFGDIAAVTPLDCWSNDVTAAYLLSRTKRNDTPGAARLAKTLGGLPLAAEQAAAYLRPSPIISFDDYAAEIARLISEERPSGAKGEYPDTVYAAFLKSLELVKTKEHGAAALDLLQLCAFLSPDGIDLQLFTQAPDARLLPPAFAASMSDKRALRDILATLSSFSLLRQQEGASLVLIFHRLLLEVVRDWMDETTASVRLNQAAKCIENGLERAETRAQVIPHAISVLYYLQRDEYSGSNTEDIYEKLAQRVIYGLLDLGSKDISPEHLAGVLSQYYEVEPLSRAILDFRQRNPKTWAEIEPSLLKENNYVLRYAMAGALADACAHEPSLIAETQARLRRADAAKEVNDFEVAAYALAHIYTSKPEEIDQSDLDVLTNHSTWLGHSIVGHLLHNLVFQVSRPEWRKIRAMAKSDQFWDSSWPYVRLQVCEIEAAQSFMGGRGASLSAKEFEECRSGLRTVRAKIDVVKKSTKDSRLRRLVDDYFALGREPEAIRQAERELAAAPNRRDLFWLFLSHPNWHVSEEAASVLCSQKDSDWPDMIEEFLTEKLWCTLYGANEAACIALSHKPELFYQSVHDNFSHDSCRIRGLCAENLVYVILTSGEERRKKLMLEFKKEITYWLKDRDSWVLEHMFRLFEALHKRGIDLSEFRSEAVSPLLSGRSRWYESGRSEWYQISRSNFLHHIEQRNRELARAERSGQLH